MNTSTPNESKTKGPDDIVRYTRLLRTVYLVAHSILVPAGRPARKQCNLLDPIVSCRIKALGSSSSDFLANPSAPATLLRCVVMFTRL